MVSIPDLYEATDHIVGQELARKRMAVALYHQQEVAQSLRPKAHGILVGGRTGVGKTFLVSSMSKACGLPFHETNATQYTDAGYIGRDLPQMFLGLIEEAARVYDQQREHTPFHVEPHVVGSAVLKRPKHELEEIVKIAESGVVFLDEFDKWLLPSVDAQGRDKGKALQAELLKLLEGSREYVTQTDDDIGIPFQTGRVLIVCGGAFVNLHKLVAARIKREDLTHRDPTFWDQIEPIDFVNFGVMPELAGRLADQIMLKPLREEHLAEIISQIPGPISDWVARFAAVDCTLEVNPAAARTVADHALQLETGARGIDFLLNKILAEPLFEAARMHAKGQRSRAVLDVFAVNRRQAYLEAA